VAILAAEQGAGARRRRERPRTDAARRRSGAGGATAGLRCGGNAGGKRDAGPDGSTATEARRHNDAGPATPLVPGIGPAVVGTGKASRARGPPRPGEDAALPQPEASTGSAAWRSTITVLRQAGSSNRSGALGGYRTRTPPTSPGNPTPAMAGQTHAIGRWRMAAGRAHAMR